MSCPIDLDADSRLALEFDELLEWVASFARTGPGAGAMRSLHPVTDLDSVRGELASVEEVRCIVLEGDPLVPPGLPDPGPALALLPVSGTGVAAPALRDLASNLDLASDLRSRLLGLAQQEFPLTRSLGQALPDLSTEARVVLRAVDTDGQIADNASPQLRRIRSERTRISERLRKTLQSIIRDPTTDSAIQDDFITRRNGRYVIPVRSDGPRQIRGIVHASSSSGATRFVEPLDSVEMNNDLVRMAEREHEEEQRLLLLWTASFRERMGEVHEALAGLTRVDGFQARALFAGACGGVVPQVVGDGPLRLVEARHPLLDRKLTREAGSIVPLNLELDPPDRVLIVSGPNTGGKTVALKTLGLAVLMAQAGIPVPAVSVELPLYRQVRADIGDHQSIQASLSTYSAHIQAVVECLASTDPPALMLFDEIGSGTEPTEGAALAQAVLEELSSPGITTVATTHQRALKAWAVTTEGAETAAMEFDSVSLLPTYRILMGTAGVSAGLDIAARLGLDPAVVDRAKSYLGEGAARGEAYLERLRELTAELEDRRQDAERRQQELAQAAGKATERAERQAAGLRRDAERALDSALREMRASLKRELSAVRGRREKAAAVRELASVEARLRLERKRQQVSLESGTTEPLAAGKLVCGATVFVHSLAREGRVKKVRGERVEVEMGNVTFSVDASDLRGGQSASRPSAERNTPKRRDQVVAPVSLEPVTSELKLIGKTVDEALGEIDKFLDGACLSGCDQVRVIHGYGTGRLREAVRRFLDSHPQVRRWRPGGKGEGDDGATIVELR